MKNNTVAKSHVCPLPQLSDAEVETARGYVRIAMRKHSALVYATVSMDFCLSKEDVESELLYLLLRMVSKHGKELLSRRNYVDESLYHALVSFSRKLQSKKRKPEYGVELISIDAQEPVSDSDSQPSRELEDPRMLDIEKTAVARMHLEQTLAKMSESDRRLFMLLYVEKCSQREAASIFGVTQPMIHQRKRKIDKLVGFETQCGTRKE